MYTQNILIRFSEGKLLTWMYELFFSVMQIVEYISALT